MAIRWETPVERVQFGFLGRTKMFTLIHPVAAGGVYLLRCSLPGRASAHLATETWTTVELAQERADRFMGHWLTRYRLFLDEPLDKED